MFSGGSTARSGHRAPSEESKSEVGDWEETLLYFIVTQKKKSSRNCDIIEGK